MGITGINPLSLLLTLAIVIVLFGTKRLRSIGEDLGAALKSFRKGLNEGEGQKEDETHKTLEDEEKK